MQLKHAIHNTWDSRKGDYLLAAHYIKTENWSNEKIAKESGVSKERIPKLRQDVVKGKVDTNV
jgi:hypothetical protein